MQVKVIPNPDKTGCDNCPTVPKKPLRLSSSDDSEEDLFLCRPCAKKLLKELQRFLYPPRVDNDV